MVAQAPAAHDVTIHQVPYAGVATRAVGLTADSLIVQGGLLILAGMTSLVAQLVGGVHLGPVAKLLAASGWALITATYFVAFWTIDGQTPGMRAMHVTVTKADADVPPGFVRSVIRIVGLAICILTLGLGFIPVLFDNRRRGLHDMMARTVVRYTGAGSL